MVLYIKKQNEIVKQEPNYFTKEIADGKKTTREQILEDLLFDYPELIPHAFADAAFMNRWRTAAFHWV